MNNYELRSNLENGILNIEFSHEKANCLSIELVSALRKVLTNNVGDPSIKVVYIRPISGNVYSAGANLGDYKALASVERIADYLSEIGLLLTDILYFPCTTISKIEGKAVGGGVGLLSAFDYVVSSTSASIRLSELSLGIAPLVISPFLVLKLGNAKFSELSFSGLWKDSLWAYLNGLVSELVESDKLDVVVKERIAHFSSSGLTPAKDLKNRILPKQNDFVEIVKENSRLNAPYVFDAIKNHKL